MREERAQHGKQAASSESYKDHRHILAHNQDPSCKCFYIQALLGTAELLLLPISYSITKKITVSVTVLTCDV